MRVFYWFLGLAAVLVGTLVALSLMSREPNILGMKEGRLRPCPETPNCVISEGMDPSTAPLAFEGDPMQAWQAARASVEELGGTVRTDDAGYLWATFTSRIFRFVDDLELRLDADESAIHVRSASRVGHSDLGVNGKRVEALRAGFRERTGTSVR